jgi:hypothetical protein
MELQNQQNYTFKLTTGEEIVAKFIARREHVYIITMPVMILPGERGIQMMPYCFSGITNVEIALNIHAVVMVAEVREDINRSYVEATTGIKTPAPKRIILE